MIRPETIIQLKAFARQDGAILGAVWIVSFLCSMYALQSPLAGSLGNLLALSTPFIVGIRLREFRNYALDGVISFRRAFFYCICTFFYATLLLTLTQYLYFRFLDHGDFVNLQVLPAYKMMFEAWQIPQEEAKQVMEAVSYFSPITWASLFMLCDLLMGFVLSFPIAAILTRRAKG